LTSTVTVTSTTTLVADQITIPSGMPLNCTTTYPAGLDLTRKNYFLLTNATYDIAQICIQYSFDPQNTSGYVAGQIVNGTLNANFSNSVIMYQDSFGNGSQGGPLPFDLVSPNPSHFVFNTTGQSVVVVYTIGWWFTFSNFIPSYVSCGSVLDGIGISNDVGPGYSGVNSSCPAGAIDTVFDIKIVGTSYFELETAQ
jgi:hypothetical protein